jgi:cbb3-type cytochrome oxidase maturation protein
MSILYFLIPLSLVLLGLAVWAFFWAVNSGQFDDLDSPAWRILLEDDRKPPADGPEAREDTHDPNA